MAKERRLLSIFVNNVRGILSEVISVGNKMEKVIVGIGINLNNKVPKEGISLRKISDMEIDKDKILKKILDNFNRISQLGITTIVRRYKEHCNMLGNEIKVKTLRGEFSGKAIDIDYEGNLLLETEDGVVRLNEGDASIL